MKGRKGEIGMEWEEMKVYRGKGKERKKREEQGGRGEGRKGFTLRAKNSRKCKYGQMPKWQLHPPPSTMLAKFGVRVYATIRMVYSSLLNFVLIFTYSLPCGVIATILYLWPPCVAECGHYIFALWFLLSSIFFPRLISAVAEWISTVYHTSTIGKKLVKQQYLIHMSSQYGGVRPIIAADIDSVVWGTPANFNGFPV